jgi:hypothetical protein
MEPDVPLAPEEPLSVLPELPLEPDVPLAPEEPLSMEPDAPLAPDGLLRMVSELGVPAVPELDALPEPIELFVPELPVAPVDPVDDG